MFKVPSWWITVFNDWLLNIISDSQKPDPRTVDYLEKSLKATSTTTTTIGTIAADLVLREIYQDDIRLLQERLLNLQKSLSSSKRSSRTTTPDSTPRTPEAAPKTNGLVTPQQLQEIINEKDQLIKRKDAEYEKLKKLLDDTQKHMDNVLALNSQYLTIIGQLNTMHMAGVTPRATEKDMQLADLEQKLIEAEERVEELSTDLSKVSVTLERRQTEAEKLMRRELKYKELLGLPDDVAEEEVEARIQELLTDGRMQHKELVKIQKELHATKEARTEMEMKVTSLAREKDHIAFQLRQQDLTIKRMQRQRVAATTIPAAEHMIAQSTSIDGSPISIRLPAISRPDSRCGLTTRTSLPTGRQYCVLCRSEFFPMKSPMCRLHYRPLRDHRWTCCKDDCHRSAGCLQVSHYYIEITHDRKLFLTDGAKYWELTWRCDDLSSGESTTPTALSPEVMSLGSRSNSHVSVDIDSTRWDHFPPGAESKWGVMIILPKPLSHPTTIILKKLHRPRHLLEKGISEADIMFWV